MYYCRQRGASVQPDYVILYNLILLSIDLVPAVREEVIR